jgi:hypothetical protein
MADIVQRKGRGEERVAKLQDSPDCPESEATYIISNGYVVLPFLELLLLTSVEAVLRIRLVLKPYGIGLLI